MLKPWRWTQQAPVQHAGNARTAPGQHAGNARTAHGQQAAIYTTSQQPHNTCLSYGRHTDSLWTAHELHVNNTYTAHGYLMPAMLISCSSAFRTKMHVGITPAMHGQHMDDTWILCGEDMARQNKPPTDTCNHEHTNDHSGKPSIHGHGQVHTHKLMQQCPR